MAYNNPNPSSSLALIALALIATSTSLCHAAYTRPAARLPGFWIPIALPSPVVLPPPTVLPPEVPPLISVTVMGNVACGASLSPLPIAPDRPVNVTLSCDGGRTAVVPPVTTRNGSFAIIANGTAATLINPMQCAGFVMTPVAGCPAVNNGQALRAPLVAVEQDVPPILNSTRILIALTFSLVTTA